MSTVSMPIVMIFEVEMSKKVKLVISRYGGKSGQEYYSHEDMVRIADEAKNRVLLDIEKRVKANFGQKLDKFTLISREGVLKDIEIIRINNGL